MWPVPLTARSRHSLGFGTASVEALVERAAALDLPALGLTDIETLAGQIRFHHACASAGVAPVSGVELRPGHARHASGDVAGRLVLLARDEGGYANLCRIVSRRRTRPPTQPAGDPVAALGGRADGLFLLTDDIRVLARLREVDGIARDAIRVLLTRPAAVRGALADAAAAAGIGAVAGPDPVTLAEEERDLHALAIAVRHGVTIDDVRAAELDAAGRQPFDARILEPFEGLPAAVGETHRVASACGLDLTRPRRIPSRLPELDAASVAPTLRARCVEALAARPRGPHATGRYDARLERELGAIERLGFSDYVLGVAEIVRGAGDLGVETAGRGSAAASLVAYLLGITDVDPVEADLLFERFLHERREAPPDIDLDVASVGRAALTDWVRRRFGRERVAGVATYQTFRARSAVRAGLAALGVAPRHAGRALGRLDPGEVSGDDEAELVEAALTRSPVDAVRDAAPLVRRLVGMPSHLSAHPGGVVIGDGPLDALAPLERAPSGGVVTQYDSRAVKGAGLLKIDLLGNHFLSELQAVRATLPSLGDIPDDDPETWSTLDRADTIGCFQVESPVVRSVLRRLPVRRFQDLVAALAVVRPGAASGASKERYVRRARGEEAWRALEILGGDGVDTAGAELRERLARSYGVLLYDEDIIRLLAAVGGMRLAAADALRTAIVAAGDAPEALAELAGGFVSGAVASGAERRFAERAFQSAARFASYSFAEAHAASLAVLAWRAAWLRTHAPTAFGAALIDHHRALYPLRTTAAAVTRWGVTLLPPSANRSQLASTVEGARVVRIGLASVKGLTRRTAAALLEARPFRDLGHLLDRVRPRARELRALLLSGACDELPPLTPDGYPTVHEAVLQGILGEGAPDALQDAVARVARAPVRGEEGERWRAYQRLVRVRNEIAHLDMHPSDHPMRLLRADAARIGCLPSTALPDRVGRFVRVAGLLAASRRVDAREGPMRFVTFEDEAGLVEGVLFPSANARVGERLTTPGPYLVGGVVRAAHGDVHLEVTELAPFHER